ncbi:ABC transporter ATP-binding protein [Streptomyces sp. HPF1205]|uniref:ABC transporter ATP-binding protein n=1 Tax=Streptomyces sp. HPF1205 TaxID=2873262 RepID=UPI001CED5E23|nr:ABC transporter ATP-binding protein [Streptomyces sp. HPF1205]
MARTGAAIRLRGLRKSYGGTDAVAGIDLDVRHGEFFSLLGPSGSGKTTTLRLIAGFEEPTEGSVELAGQDVTGLAPYERDVHTVFQDYALFPHMTVEQNVGYALKVRGVPRAERAERVRAALASVRLEGHGRRRPARLSGGQRQRVALARALIDRPAVLLLDEPLAALDPQLRGRMQAELKELQREVGITFVFVTHDQGEALSMSDRVAVFHAGRIEQVGTPAEVYERPATAFVAGFVGGSNLLGGEPARRVTGGPGPYSVRPERITLSAASEDPAGGGAPYGGAGREGAARHRVSGVVADAVYLGHAVRVLVDLDTGGRLTVLRHAGEPAAEAATGARVTLSWPAAHAVPLPADPARRPEPAAGPDHDPDSGPGAPATVPAP